MGFSCKNDLGLSCYEIRRLERGENVLRVSYENNDNFRKRFIDCYNTRRRDPLKETLDIMSSIAVFEKLYCEPDNLKNVLVINECCWFGGTEDTDIYVGVRKYYKVRHKVFKYRTPFEHLAIRYYLLKRYFR